MKDVSKLKQAFQFLCKIKKNNTDAVGSIKKKKEAIGIGNAE